MSANAAGLARLYADCWTQTPSLAIVEDNSSVNGVPQATKGERKSRPKASLARGIYDEESRRK